MKLHYKSLLTYIWTIFVLASIGLYLSNSPVTEIVTKINASNIAMAYLVLLLAKILLGANQQLAMLIAGKKEKFLVCLEIYATTQLGKYIPGNIWHFVGKAVAYNKIGMKPDKIQIAMIAENFWLLLSSIIYGFCVMVLSDLELLSSLLAYHFRSLMFFVIIFTVIVFLLNKNKKVNFKPFFSDFRTNAKLFFILMLSWFFLGSGFSILSSVFINENVSFFMVTGLYSIAFSIGFVTPFAPAGIGVREGILIIGLSNHLNAETALTISLANRLIYLSCELTIVVISRLLNRIRQTSIRV